MSGTEFSDRVESRPHFKSVSAEPPELWLAGKSVIVPSPTTVECFRGLE